MQLAQINIAFLLVFLFVHSTKADLRKCADFEPEIDVNKFAYESELEQVFDSFNGTNPEETAELFQLMQRIEEDETNSENFISSAKLLRYVVSLMNTKPRKVDFLNQNLILITLCSRIASNKKAIQFLSMKLQPMMAIF